MGFKRPRSVRDQDDGDSSDSSLEVFSPDEWRRNSSNLTTPSVEPKPVLKMQRQSPTASTPRQRQSTGVKKEYREEPARPHHAKLEPPSSPRPGRETSSRSSRSKRKGKEKEKDPAASESSSDWLSRIERYSKLTDEALETTSASSFAVESRKRAKPDMAASASSWRQADDSVLIAKGTLKDFQLKGVRWIISRHQSVSGCLLADEMGTGKTIQSIAFLAFLREQGLYGFNLVVCPLAVLYNWEAEFKRWAPKLPILIFHGDKDAQKAAIKRLDDCARPERDYARPIIITTFETARKSPDFLARTQGGDKVRYKFNVMVVDEAQRIKNAESQTHSILNGINAEFRLLLTGTPIQNNLGELHALLAFTLPVLFKDKAVFDQAFTFENLTSLDGSTLSKAAKEAILVGRLKGVLQPFMLRRLKADVAHDLPLKKEYILYAPMTERQRQLYIAAKEKGLPKLLLQERRLESSSSTATIVQQSPIVVNHDEPRIGERMAGLQRAATLTSGSNVIDLTGSDFEDDEEDLLSMPVVRSPVKIKSESTKLAEAPKRGRVNAEEEKTRMAINGGAKSVIMHLRQIANHPWLADPTGGPKEDEERREGLVGLSGKVMLLARLLERVFAAKGNSKVLVFSQFTSALDLISEWAGIRGYEHLQLDGDNRPEQEDIDEFNRVDSTACRLFLLSTRAGGVGITLTGADTVIIFDSDWNPQNDLQAMDRAHRIGQTRPVLVFRLETENSVDGLIIARATGKRKLDQLVLGGGGGAGGGASSSSSSAAQNLFGGGGRQKTTTTMRPPTLNVILEQLLSVEGERVRLATGEELEGVLDRSEEVMRGRVGAAVAAGKGKVGKKAGGGGKVWAEVETVVLDEENDSEEEEEGVGAGRGLANLFGV